MEAKELRLGNIGCVLHPGCPVVLDIARLKAILDGDTTYKPIPLTEAWLFKLGFEINPTYDGAFSYLLESYPNGAKSELIIDMELAFCFIGATADKNVIKNSFLPIQLGYDMQYVHQLQNLYFALKGKELQVAEPAVAIPQEGNPDTATAPKV